MMRPAAIPAYVTELRNPALHTTASRTAAIKATYTTHLLTAEPLVSIVIPAYNEEAEILRTLQSICAGKPSMPVEIIVVNNNSTDNTGVLVQATGITCVFEAQPGVTHARNAGLEAARGTYIVNADADTIYPPDWLDRLVVPIINDPSVCLTYGRYAFIPTGNTSRFTYFLYEQVVDLLRWVKKTFREEAVNVGGCNSCFRKAEAMQVDRFNHPPGANEDGYLALKLRNKGFGKLKAIMDANAIVWTTDRRIQIDGGLIQGIWKRLKRLV